MNMRIFQYGPNVEEEVRCMTTVTGPASGTAVGMSQLKCNCGIMLILVLSFSMGITLNNLQTVGGTLLDATVAIKAAT